MFKPNAKFVSDSLLCPLSHFVWVGYTVHMLTQWHLPPPLTSTVKSSLFMHAHSSPLSMAAILIILTTTGLFSDRPHTSLLSPLSTSIPYDSLSFLELWRFRYIWFTDPTSWLCVSWAHYLMSEMPNSSTCPWTLSVPSEITTCTLFPPTPPAHLCLFSSLPASLHKKSNQTMWFT